LRIADFGLEESNELLAIFTQVGKTAKANYRKLR
jgi:hypothetical protein